jgi:hypothetical protein
MKRGLSIVLIILILLYSGGYSYASDYCNYKKKYSLSLDHKAKCCCSNKARAMKNCCSKTKIVIKKISDNYTNPTNLKVPVLIAAAAGSNSNISIHPFFQRVISTIPGSKPAPDIPISLNILYCSMLI